MPGNLNPLLRAVFRAAQKRQLVLDLSRSCDSGLGLAVQPSDRGRAASVHVPARPRDRQRGSRQAGHLPREYVRLQHGFLWRAELPVVHRLHGLRDGYRDRACQRVANLGSRREPAVAGASPNGLWRRWRRGLRDSRLHLRRLSVVRAELLLHVALQHGREHRSELAAQCFAGQLRDLELDRGRSITAGVRLRRHTAHA